MPSDLAAVALLLDSSDHWLTRISQFQEYFAARALCEAGTVLSGSPPWQWPAWWSNALSLGVEMGDDFRLGLLRTAGVAGGGTLDLSNGELGGDRKTTLRVVVELMAVLTELE